MVDVTFLQSQMEVMLYVARNPLEVRYQNKSERTIGNLARHLTASPNKTNTKREHFSGGSLEQCQRSTVQQKKKRWPREAKKSPCSKLSVTRPFVG